ncbi:transcription factor RFX4-like isoform X2 [Dysidea avara]|uniref:transcription factor RFX4-like isoform X2 n=1 Tax=Dysidea avara TaxID=196820 RepID=UPI0033336F7B
MDGEFEGEDGPPMVNLQPHSTQTTIRWLEENYDLQEGICLPRNTIYSHYLDYCSRSNYVPINAASFGKIVRQRFPKLTTRRLGTRGQSKYHYYGLGIKTTSRYYSKDYADKQANPAPKKEHSQKVMHRHYTTRVKPSAILPKCPDVKGLILSDNLPEEKVRTFMVMYHAHCQRIYDAISRANFNEIENFLLHFWQGMPEHMLTILDHPLINDILLYYDLIVYKTITTVLVFTPLQQIPESLTEEIRTFAASLPGWLKTALKDLPELLVKTKEKALDLFCKRIKRLTSLVQLAKAARVATRTHDSLDQMRNDWQKVDLKGVLCQTVWVMDELQFADGMKDIIIQYLSELHPMIRPKMMLEDFAEWIENAVSSIFIMGNRVDDGEDHMRALAANFMKVWSFFITKVTRELTLLSATSFGSFHLLHMMVDNYLLHTLESQFEQQEEDQYKKQMLSHYSEQEKQAYIVEIEEAQMMISDQSGSSSDEVEEETAVSVSAHQPIDHTPHINTTRRGNHIDNVMDQGAAGATIQTELNLPIVSFNNICNDTYNMAAAVMASTNSMSSHNLIGATAVASYTPSQPLLPMLQQEPLLPAMMYQPPQQLTAEPLPPHLRQQFPPISGYPTIPGFPPAGNFLQPHPTGVPVTHSLPGSGMFRMQ